MFVLFKLVCNLCQTKRLKNNFKTFRKQLASYKKKQLRIIAIVGIQNKCQICKNMRNFNTFQQIKILNTCKSAIELMETKELLEELQPLNIVAKLVFNRMMTYFFETNKIVCNG